ncbi:MerR family DNA-binding transcriptional regulator [Streptomyces sp. MCAF7]
MRIGDAAAAAGLTPRALRYYEQRGLLTEPRADGSRADGEPGLCTLPNMIVRRRLAYLDERIERLTELRDGLAQRVGGPLRDLGRDLDRGLDPMRTPAAG